jgi:hypothetical protein
MMPGMAVPRFEWDKIGVLIESIPARVHGAKLAHGGAGRPHLEFEEWTDPNGLAEVKCFQDS